MGITKVGAAHRSKRNWLAVATVVATTCMLFLTACGSDSQSSGDAESGSIRVMVPTDVADAVSALAKDYEAQHEGVKIEVQSLPTDQLQTTATTQINGGTPADLIATTPGTGGTLTGQTLAAAGKIIELSDQPWVDKVPPELSALWSVDGKTYGYEPEAGLIGLIYDPAVFDSLHLTVPTTFPEMLTLCKSLSASGKTPISLGVSDLVGAVFPTYALVASGVYGDDPNWTTERADGKTTFASTPGWTSALNRFKEMDSAGCFNEGAAGTTWQSAEEQIAKGDAVMHIAVNSALGTLKGLNPKADWTIAPFPGADSPDENRVPFGGGAGYVIPTRAKNPALAKAFLSFIAEHNNEYAKARGVIGVADIASPDSVTLPPNYVGFDSFLEQGKVVVYLDQTWPVGVAIDLVKGVQGMIAGQSSVEDVLSTVDKSWDSASGS